MCVCVCARACAYACDTFECNLTFFVFLLRFDVSPCLAVKQPADKTNIFVHEHTAAFPALCGERRIEEG